MGWYTMPEQKVKNEYIEWEYCNENSCEHKDCERYWEDRNRPCSKCNKIIKPGDARYFTGKDSHEHFVCYHS